MKTKTIIITTAILALPIAGVIWLATSGGASPNTSAKELISVQAISHGHGLAVDPNDQSKVYIATHYGLLLLKDEKNLYQVGNKRDDYMGFSPHPTDSNVFFSSGHPSIGGNIGFQKSEDGGFTWKKISNGLNGPVDFHAMAVSPVDPNIVYGWYQGNIQRSTDQGKTWEIAHRNVLAVYLVADSQNENIVYAADPQRKGVLVSRDKGVSWQLLSKELEGGGVSVIVVHPTNASILLAFSEKLGGLGKSSDAGQTWKKVDESFGGETVLHIAFDRSNPAMLYALTHENKLYKSVDTGERWKQVQ